MKNQYRFYVERELHSGCSFDADEGLGFQLGRVLRLSCGDTVSLFGINKKEFLTRVSFHGRKITLTPLRETAAPEEPETRLTLLLALSKKDKPEAQVRSCTELGVSEFVFFCSGRSVAKPDMPEQKTERLARVACEAAEQCGRVTVPRIGFCSPEDIDYSAYDACAVCSGPASEKSLKDIRGRNVLVAVGPEGGFSGAELDFFEEKGFTPVSLGSLVLRSETAAAAAAACLLIK